MAYRLGNTYRTVWNRRSFRPQMKNNSIRVCDMVDNTLDRLFIGRIMHRYTAGFNLFLVVMPVFLVRPFGNRRSSQSIRDHKFTIGKASVGIGGLE